MKNHRNFFWYTMFTLYMLCAVPCFHQYNDNGLWFYHYCIYVQIFFCKYSRYAFSCDCFWLSSFHMIDWLTSVYIVFIFYTIKRPYLGHWIFTRNMFTYFCCRWFFKIIFTFIYSFNQRFKIFIKSRWCLIRFFGVN